MKNDKTPSPGIFFTRASLIFLEIRQDSCGKSPCLTKKSVSIRHFTIFKQGLDRAEPDTELAEILRVQQERCRQTYGWKNKGFIMILRLYYG